MNQYSLPSSLVYSSQSGIILLSLPYPPAFQHRFLVEIRLYAQKSDCFMLIIAAILFPPPPTCLFSCKLISLSVFVCVSYYMHSSLALSAVFLVHCLRNTTKLYDFLSFFLSFFLMWTIFNGLCWICYNTVSVLCFVFLPSRYVGCGILALLPENKHTPPALEGKLFNHWATREVCKL